MYAFRVLAVSVLTGIGSCLLHGQDNGKDMAAVRAQFEDPGSIAWVESFQGTWQGLHQMRMILGYDGTDYLGSCMIGGQKFELSGAAVDQRIVLQEIDNDGTTSGFYILRINEGKMTGHWQSLDQTRSAVLSLRNHSVVELRRFQPEVLVLNGTMDNKTASLILQREEPDLLSGFYGNESGTSYYRLAGTCEDPACERMVLAASGVDIEDMQLRVTRQAGTAYRLTLSEKNSVTQQVGQANILQRYPLQIVCDYAYCGSIDYICPQLNIPAFDAWIRNQLETWRMGAIGIMDSLELDPERSGPVSRWSLRNSAWVDLTLITAEEVSGIITLFNTRNGTYDRMSFIYDVRAGKPVEVSEMSRKPQFANLLRQDAKADLPAGDAKPLRHIALTEAGFVVFSDFDHTDGDTWTMLPYDRYADSYRRNAIVRKFLKSD